VKTSFKWIKFTQIYDTGKTSVYQVEHHDGTGLGTVEWYPRWRQYCFCPDGGMVFSKGCLEDINVFMVDLRATELRVRREKALANSSD